MSKVLTQRGYVTAEHYAKIRRLLIGTEGETDTGKTEFLMSAPGPVGIICYERGHEACLQNPNPPKWRRRDVFFKSISAPALNNFVNPQANQSEYSKYWTDFRDEFYTLLGEKEVRTVGVDGDSDTWETQRLAAFGKLTQIKAIHYDAVNAARRAMITKAYDAGKIVIATNKLRPKYVQAYDAQGKPKMEDGRPVKERSGELERQGFHDQSYLWQIQLRHLKKAPEQKIIQLGPRRGQTIISPRQWGIRILKCKFNMALEGTELWGDDCNFQGLVQLVFPNVPLSEWGY